MLKFVPFTLFLLVAVSSAKDLPPVQELINPPEDDVVVELQKLPAEDSRGLTELNGTVFRCGHHEEFIDCPDAQTCQRTCTTLNHACVITPTCTPGCFCKWGFARDVNNRCVPISDCPGTGCPRNEEFIVCSPTWKCEKTCAGRNAECPEEAYCQGGCQCREGYFRDANNICTKARSCVIAATNAQCPTNEIWRACSNACINLCFPPDDCQELPCSPGCFCETGFSRINGRCVPTSKCV